MFVNFDYNGKNFRVDLTKPLDISIPLSHGALNPNAWHAPDVDFSPVVSGDFVGSTAAGGLVNFFDVKLNPHGNGTHTECVGHISKERITINQQLKQFLHVAALTSIQPKNINGDSVIIKDQFENELFEQRPQALVIRTLPNSKEKLNRQYSGTNPPFFHPEAIEFIVSKGIDHLIVDLPSIDPEQDEGKLLGHKAFWNYPLAPRTNSTITEFAYIPNSIPDGNYICLIMIASFELDASPSKVILYELL